MPQKGFPDLEWRLGRGTTLPDDRDEISPRLVYACKVDGNYTFMRARGVWMGEEVEFGENNEQVNEFAPGACDCSDGEGTRIPTTLVIIRQIMIQEPDLVPY